MQLLLQLEKAYNISLTITALIERLPQPFNDYNGTDSFNRHKMHKTPPQKCSAAGFAYALKHLKRLISSGFWA